MFRGNKITFIRRLSTESNTRDFSKKDEQRKFFAELAKKLNLSTKEDWYKLTYRDIVNNGGKSLVRKYNNSPVKAIKSILNEQDWEVH